MVMPHACRGVLLMLALVAPAWGAPPGPRADPFDVVGWVDLAPQDAYLIRNGQKLDVTARESDDTTSLTVYGPRRKPNLRPVAPDDDYTPLGNDAAIPRDVRYLPPTSCANSAYQTIGGQPATGQDLIGQLGSGGC